MYSPTDTLGNARHIHGKFSERTQYARIVRDELVMLSLLVPICSFLVGVYLYTTPTTSDYFVQCLAVVSSSVFISLIALTVKAREYARVTRQARHYAHRLAYALND